jgi:uncharacterized Zn finger protein
MDDYGFYDYESVGEKTAKAKKQLEKLRKKNPDISPIVIEGKTIAKSWWGKAWTKNLETYADYDNRIDRGRSYVKNGLVLDLRIEEGYVTALVFGSGSRLYNITVTIKPYQKNKLNQLTHMCNHSINGLEDLLEGKFPQSLAELFTTSGEGLFPSSKEISFDCSCPDGAYMCKHVSAALYGIGAKFDFDPTLFFKLRGIDFKVFLAKTVDEKMSSMLKNAGKKSHRVIADEDVTKIFGAMGN